ncbi:MAG: class I SAM-dependent methyltransferase [Bacteroidetes bacterium]|nr:class I SAM-dependent methyltransferase [Bacteroidota bacterium]MBP7398163.1 class I SAM-dependent methyltransferase [Chitinophagales bacterium]MBK8486437.1 class I SAM-dependent methyltransferase [Bacteroidota bacterium]MBK8683217.1 class I SAM-dependent methyltransferase [Bacteroidota bacterium]MBP8753149.1 class I SAM-dependent methyltransferase [Chitinophagales bacterium]
MEIILSQIEQYISDHTTEETAALKELNRQTHLKAMMPQMLSGKVQGKVLEFISRMMQPKSILEIGTYTGYSGICLAKGLQPGGKIITIDINDELTPMVKDYVAKENLTNAFEILTGNALQIIPTLHHTFDLVFIDADKQNYANYYDLVFDKLVTGGWIIADNVLWSGKVVETEKDKDTLAIDAFNKKIQKDTRVENVIMSVRDGLMIVRKIG